MYQISKEPTIRNKNIFITGITGFLGSCLAKELLKEPNTKLTALVRHYGNKSAHKRVEETLSGYDTSGIEIVEGDIAKPNLGFSSQLESKLIKEIDEIWHLAGSTDMGGKRTETFLNNVEGTNNVLEFANKIPKLRLFNYASTAYVAGDRQGTVLEEELDVGQKFRNPYEESKFEAEKIVRAYLANDIKGVIFRPSILTGNSLTGETQNFKMIYAPWMMVDLAKRMFLKRTKDLNYDNEGNLILPLRVIGKEDATINIIPVDYAIVMMLRIAESEEGIGKTFHLTNPEYTTLGVLRDVISKRLRVSGIECVDSFKGQNPNFIERFYERSARPYQPYMLNNDPTFDMSNTRSIIHDLNIPKPNAELLTTLLNYCISTID